MRVSFTHGLTLGLIPAILTAFYPPLLVFFIVPITCLCLITAIDIVEYLKAKNTRKKVKK